VLHRDAPHRGRKPGPEDRQGAGGRSPGPGERRRHPGRGRGAQASLRPQRTGEPSIS
jgi:hypothetical protein